MYSLRHPYPDECPAIVRFIFECQASPASRCLHLDWTEAGIDRDVQDLNQPFEEAFRLVCAGETVIGVLGCDLDIEAGRGWLHGPFALDQDWDEVVGLLFAELWNRLPTQITRVSNYLECAFARGLAFHERFGFVPKGLSHIYKAEYRSATPVAAVRPFLPSDAEALCALHARAFPQSWLSGPQMIAKLADDNAVLIAWHEGHRAGYIRLSRHVSLSEGSVDFVAVEPGWRGKGLGRQLLLAGLHWIFVQQHLRTALLNVSDSNTNARQLYESAGFELFQSGVALDWWKK
jgi:ribosomal protein S18 acetylase RimI-like enzyme